MKTKHTPGPWSVSKLGSIEFEKGYLGEAYDYDPNIDDELPMMANARLMAAAPLMLQLLQDLTGFDSIRKASAKRMALNLISQFVTQEAGDY